MKKILLLLVFAALLNQKGAAQNSSTNYPNVTSDLVGGKNLNFVIKHRITMPGVWGIGLNTEYQINHLIYASAEAGYGWVIGEHPQDFDKKFRGWFEIKAGYPILNFTESKNGKWVTGRSSTHDYYYNIDVPAHYSLIGLAGFVMEPTTIKIYPDGNGTGGAVQPFSFQAPVYTLGIKWQSYVKANVKVRKRTGSVQRKFELYAGLIIPAKDEIITPDNWRNISKTEKLGYELFFSFPYRLNGWATFDFGIKSLGYNDNARLYIGNTFYL